MQLQFTALTERKRQISVSGTVYNQFAAPGTWLKGECHCHLNGWEPQAAELYRSMDFDFVLGNNLDMPEGLLVVPGGEEYKTSVTGASMTHLLAIGADGPATAPSEGAERIERMMACIRQVKEQGGMAVLAHPFNTGWGWDDLPALVRAGLDGLEIINGGAFRKGDTARSDQIWDLLLDQGFNLFALGGGDVKKSSTFRAGLAWTQVLAADVSAGAVVEAIRQGRTVASEGPVLKSVKIHPGGRVEIGCSPCAACHIRPLTNLGGHKGGTFYPPEGEKRSESFSFDLSALGFREEFVFDSAAGEYRARPDELTVRKRNRLSISLEDEAGRKAWLSPIWMDMVIGDEKS